MVFGCILLSFVNDLYVCARFFSSTPHGGSCLASRAVSSSQRRDWKS